MALLTDILLDEQQWTLPQVERLIRLAERPEFDRRRADLGRGEPSER